MLDYLQHLAPKPRHAIRLAIMALTREKGDIKSLTDQLEGLHRLRVGSNRGIFEYEIIKAKR